MEVTEQVKASPELDKVHITLDVEEFREIYIIFNYHPITQSCESARKLFKKLLGIRDKYEIEYYPQFIEITDKIAREVSR